MEFRKTLFGVASGDSCIMGQMIVIDGANRSPKSER